MYSKLVILFLVLILCSCKIFEPRKGGNISVIIDDRFINLKTSTSFYATNFDENDNSIYNIFEGIKENPRIWIYLPKNIEVGKAYTQNDSEFLRGFHFSTYNMDKQFVINDTLDFELTVKKIDKKNRRISGTFSGKLQHNFDIYGIEDSVKIMNLKYGSFESSYSSELFQ